MTRSSTFANKHSSAFWSYILQRPVDSKTYRHEESCLLEKRSSFPQFYFVGDDDLLEILGQSENPRVIQTHLGKIFSGVKTVTFSEDCQRVMRDTDSQISRIVEVLV
ncbi:hypothetical protein R1flu_027364 [Riccia fluitans]|uniref:Dynein heavy chain linker domain-containing protein n=1 Tax=Riccia fluitans TaxID=41844 RepID=A0ABD1XLI4_9MARC